MRTVVALGGNALVRPGERGTAEEQLANVRATCEALQPLFVTSEKVVITHGNGPQVGQALLRQERAADEVPPLPLWLVVGQTQAEIGAMLVSELPKIAGRAVACLITRVAVDPDDPAFRAPSKPVGPAYGEAKARRLERERGWTVAEDAGRWRRVVPSPRPQSVLEAEQIAALLDAGATPVCCGGGGIPVRSADQRGVDAVIDKDRTSALLAGQLGADRLVILTNVSSVRRDFGTPAEEDVRDLSVSEAEELAPGLAAGSMGPKVEAAAAFVTATGGEALITSAGALNDALAGRAGTRLAP